MYFIDPASPPPEPLPSSVQELLRECEDERERNLAAMRAGYELHPGTKDNFIALGTGKIKGFLFARLGRLFDAAIALDLGDVTDFPGEPQNGRDAVIALDILLAWCRAKQQPAPAGPEPPAEGKGRGGRKKLEESNPALADLYEKIVRAQESIIGYADTVSALKRQHDIMALARQAGDVPINSDTIDRAIEWWRQRVKRSAVNQQANKLESD